MTSQETTITVKIVIVYEITVIFWLKSRLKKQEFMMQPFFYGTITVKITIVCNITVLPGLKSRLKLQ